MLKLVTVFVLLFTPPAWTQLPDLNDLLGDYVDAMDAYKDDGSCPKGNVWCLTCNAHDEAACYWTGRYLECDSPDDVCFHSRPNNKKRKGIIRGCKPKADCPKAAIGLDNYDCPDDGSGRCINCDNGPIGNPLILVNLPEQLPRALCEDPGFGLCYCKGDPHCSSFDLKLYSHMNVGCWHLFTQDDCCDAQPHGNYTFQVWIRVERLVSHPTNWKVSAIKIVFGGSTLELAQIPFEYSLGAAWQTSGPGLNLLGAFPMFNSGSMEMSVITLLTSGVVIFWDYKNTVAVRMLPFCRSHVCGICGNYDSDPDVGDYVYGPSANDGYCPELDSLNLTASALPENEILFSMSWYIEHPGDEECGEACQHPGP